MCIHPREFILAYGFTSVLYVCVFGTECIALVGVVCAHEPTSMHHVQRIRMLQKRCVCSSKLVLLTSDARDNDDWGERNLFKKRLPGVPVVAFYVPRSTSGFVGQPCTRDLLQALASCHVTRKGVKRPAADFMRDLLAGSSEQQDGVLEEDFCAGLEVGNVGGAGAGTEASMPLDGNARRENTFITVCLVGDPNMGKSSLMNSVFGKKIVSSSSTPGHTKHIQTYFLSRQLCMCDAPGIVCPRLDIPRELQVIFGTFRIAQVREPYSIIRYAADRCWPPLDAVYALDRFRDEADEGEWSPWSLCAAFAIKKSFKSKGGKPETHRAALMMLKDMMLGQKVRDAKAFTHKTL